MKDMTLTVEITGRIYGYFEWRRRVASALFRLAARILGTRIEFR